MKNYYLMIILMTFLLSCNNSKVILKEDKESVLIKQKPKCSDIRKRQLAAGQIEFIQPIGGCINDSPTFIKK